MKDKLISFARIWIGGLFSLMVILGVFSIGIIIFSELKEIFSLWFAIGGTVIYFITAIAFIILIKEVPDCVGSV